MSKDIPLGMILIYNKLIKAQENRRILMLKAVIFDMDGVIIDSEPAHVKFEKQIFNSLGITVTEEEHMGFVGTTSQYMWETLKVKNKLQHSLVELVNNDRQQYLEYLKSDKNEVVLIDGVREFIKELHENGVKLAIASSSPLDVIKIVVDRYELGEFFDELVTGDFVKNSKPAPDIFLYAASRFCASPEECVVIEDSCNGSKAAKNAGMKCVGYKNLNSGNQDLSCADYITDSFFKINYNILLEL